MEVIISGVVGLAAGVIVTFVIQSVLLKKRTAQIVKDAENEGEAIKKDKILQAKERFLQLKENHEKSIKDRERKLQSAEDRTKNKENTLSKKIEEVTRKEKDLSNRKTVLDEKIAANELKQAELEKVQQQRVAELSKISGMEAEEAKKMLMEALKDEARSEAMVQIKEIVDEAKLNANRDAKKIVIQSIQRIAHEQTIENAVSVFNIESDEVKG